VAKLEPKRGFSLFGLLRNLRMRADPTKAWKHFQEFRLFIQNLAYSARFYEEELYCWNFCEWEVYSQLVSGHLDTKKTNPNTKPKITLFVTPAIVLILTSWPWNDLIAIHRERNKMVSLWIVIAIPECRNPGIPDGFPIPKFRDWKMVPGLQSLLTSPLLGWRYIGDLSSAWR